MAKKIINTLKLNLRGGSANPAPPVGPILGQAGINIMDFCNKYNDLTKDKRGEMLPAQVTVYEDRSFDIEIKLAPVSAMIMKALNMSKGSGTAGAKNAGQLTQAQIAEIAEAKLPDLNTVDVDSAKKMVIGTARSMGVDVQGVEYVSSMTEEEKFAAAAAKVEAADSAAAEAEEVAEGAEGAADAEGESSAEGSDQAETTEVKE